MSTLDMVFVALAVVPGVFAAIVIVMAIRRDLRRERDFEDVRGPSSSTSDSAYGGMASGGSGSGGCDSGGGSDGGCSGG